MKKRTEAGLSAALCAAVLLAGCQTTAAVDVPADGAGMETVTSLIDTADLFSDRDLDPSYDAETAVAVTVTLEGTTASCASDAVIIEGGRITIREEGTYLLSGILTEGQVIVDAGEEDKVQLVLDGADITSASSAAIYCKSADKVFLTTAEGTEDHLSNGGTFEAIDENDIDAVVFSKCDLTLNGSGSLTVDSPAGHGIVSKDELTVGGGTYAVTAASHGLAGKDDVAIAGGSFTIISGKDAIHADHGEDTDKGFLYIADGAFDLTAQGDGLSASGDLQIDGGESTIVTGGGSAAADMKTGDRMDPGMGGGPGGQRPQMDGTAGTPPTGAPQSPEDAQQPPEGPGQTQPVDDDLATEGETAETAEEAADSTSRKGIKSDGALLVTAGTFSLDTEDDSVHAGGDVTIGGGDWTIRAGDDGIHSDAGVWIGGGAFAIPYCDEGIEGRTVTIDGGTFDITSCDDGINAAAKDSGNAPGQADESCVITINGGSITIVSDGDSIDSNGSLTVNGGTLELTCNGNGNTAIDIDGTYTNNGGDVTTNDGSENGTDEMGGGPGRGGPGGQRPQGDPPEGGAAPSGRPQTEGEAGAS
ncbi:carbohydrate-binding domain-containing protein [Pseudoflavonifractor sp. MSJ-37]|uniref:carbohydrate-binding domain-containing protein n=1 Tax=Pseudoflavonifractor sp. MSJ-37 TaxID=2841531 RepID=UPI001C0F3DED|nr:carbohydrate-binding domain-containing protein [Pseudoflavonifractor sp. MSJ-37]MBU5434992.1 carbohydrate-binding domain-containing protein [Pseudoflavonifractor sp. MSJ-37]